VTAGIVHDDLQRFRRGLVMAAGRERLAGAERKGSDYRDSGENLHCDSFDLWDPSASAHDRSRRRRGNPCPASVAIRNFPQL
jgi:hypothetical protein